MHTWDQKLILTVKSNNNKNKITTTTTKGGKCQMLRSWQASSGKTLEQTDFGDPSIKQDIGILLIYK